VRLHLRLVGVGERARERLRTRLRLTCKCLARRWCSFQASVSGVGTRPVALGDELRRHDDALAAVNTA
jgi:hypothetical protein